MSEQLSPLDATFLELEQTDESAHMHIGAILVFETGERGVPSLDELCEHFQRRLGALPRYRQRLSEPHTGGLTWPSWEEDPAFDLSAHVHRAALPAPGGDRELMEWASDYWSHRLDRRRPLWDGVVLEGLAGGRWALCTKTHHCMVDGVGSIDVGHVLLDPTADPSTEPPLPDAPVPAETHRGILDRAADAARAGAGLALHPRKLAEMAMRSRALAELIVRDEVIPAPSTSLNVPIGVTRRFDVVRVPLEDLKLIKDGLGGTVNDVVLAAATGGLRRLLVARGETPPEHGLRAMVPVNIRAAGDHLALGNRITSLFVRLPVADDAPIVRYGHSVGEAESLKSGTQAVGGKTLLDVTSHAPPVIHSMLAQALFASRLFNVTITNVPGPQVPLYTLGSRLVEIHGLVPLAAEHCVGIAVLSYDGNVSFGLIADRDTVPDLDVLREGIEDTLDELLFLARRPPERPRHIGSERAAS
jgi:diacylglycerol O-acyltransferase / wax synthase